MPPPRTSRGLDRLVNFSDATVAIAITLLILPLVDIATEVDTESLGTLLHAHSAALVSFVVTFVVIGRFWTVHHRVFEYVRLYSRPLVSANFVWLISIVFLPFAANVLAHSGGEPAVSALYIGTMIVATLASGAIDWILRADPSLVASELREELEVAPALIAATLLAAALVLAVVFPEVNLYGLFLLLLSGPSERLWRRLRSRRPASSG